MENPALFFRPRPRGAGKEEAMKKSMERHEEGGWEIVMLDPEQELANIIEESKKI